MTRTEDLSIAETGRYICRPIETAGAQIHRAKWQDISARNATAIAPTAIAAEMIPHASITSVITAKLFVQFVVSQQGAFSFCR